MRAYVVKGRRVLSLCSFFSFASSISRWPFPVVSNRWISTGLKPYRSFRSIGSHSTRWNAIDTSERLFCKTRVLRCADFRDIGRIFHVAVRCIRLQKMRLCSNFFFKFEVVRTTFARNCTNISVVLSLHVRRDRRQPTTKRIATKLGETGRNGRST